MGGLLPCVSTEWQHGRADDGIKLEVGWTVDRIGWEFDRDRMRGRILPVEETGDAQHPVSGGASGIAAEGLGD